MEKVGGEGVGERSSITQIATASFIGSAIEWYDFFLGEPWPISLFALAAGLVTLVSVLLAAETFRADLEEEQPQERQYVSTTS